MIYDTMTDDEVLQQVAECLGTGTVMNISLMQRGLQVQRNLIVMLQTDQQQLAIGLKPLNKRQSDTFDFIIAFISKNGYPPSVREIGEGVGLASSSTVHGQLERLEKKGYIKRNAAYGRPRSLQITGKREAAADEIHRNRPSD